MLTTHAYRNSDSATSSAEVCRVCLCSMYSFTAPARQCHLIFHNRSSYDTYVSFPTKNHARLCVRLRAFKEEGRQTAGMKTAMEIKTSIGIAENALSGVL